MIFCHFLRKRTILYYLFTAVFQQLLNEFLNVHNRCFRCFISFIVFSEDGEIRWKNEESNAIIAVKSCLFNKKQGRSIL